MREQPRHRETAANLKVLLHGVPAGLAGGVPVAAIDQKYAKETINLMDNISKYTTMVCCFNHDMLLVPWYAAYTMVSTRPVCWLGCKGSGSLWAFCRHSCLHMCEPAAPLCRTSPHAICT